MVNREFKTSREWYLLDTDRDIVGAHGWNRTLNSNHDDWFVEKITHEEYIKRRNLSSVTEYMKNNHAVPFDYTLND